MLLSDVPDRFQALPALGPTAQERILSIGKSCLASGGQGGWSLGNVEVEEGFPCSPRTLKQIKKLRSERKFYLCLRKLHSASDYTINLLPMAAE